MHWPTALILSTLSSLLLVHGAWAEVDFVKDIQPVLVQSCLKCHGPEKPKAGLRLDTKEGLLKGTKSTKVVVPGKADESRLYEVIMLPEDDPEHMPSEGKPLTKAETERIRDWINQGLPWPEGLVLKLAGATSPEKSPAELANEAGLPITDAEKAAVSKLQQSGALAMRLAQNTNWLRVDFSLRGKEVKEEELALLKDMSNLIELDLGGTDVTDPGLVHLKGLANLTRLELQNTKISDAGLENLKALKKLTSLNLYGTAVTDQGLEHLRELKNLRRLYLWQSKATDAGAKKLAEVVPGLDVNLGYETEPPKAEAAKPAAPEKK